MKRRALLKQLGLGFSALSLAKPTFAQNSFANFSGGEKIATGRFTPDWASLEQYQVPKWFQDAKFGMWAHWGPNVRRRQAIGMPEGCIKRATGNINIM
jgi:alpha-L-fucosidase